MVEKDYHIIVGTQKEIVSFHLLQVFKVQLLNMVVFDDADMTASTTLIKEQIIKKLPATCQKVFLSAYGMVSSPMNNIVEMKLLFNGSLFPVHIDNYYVKCRTSWKFDIIKALSADANKVAKNGKIMVFFTVCFKLYTEKVRYLINTLSFSFFSAKRHRIFDLEKTY